MSKKTRRTYKRHKKKHRTHKRHIKKHRTHKRDRTYKTPTRRHLHIKSREIVTLPGNKGIPLFSTPINKPNKIMINSKMESGNMIPGLRNM